MENVMVGTRMEWLDAYDADCRRPVPAGQEPNRQELVSDRDGGRNPKGGVEMDSVPRIVISGITVWLAILAGMTAFL